MIQPPHIILMLLYDMTIGWQVDVENRGRGTIYGVQKQFGRPTRSVNSPLSEHSFIHSFHHARMLIIPAGSTNDCFY